MICELCQTDESVEKHHIIPRSKGGVHKGTIECCSDCGSQIHMLFNVAELALMTLEDLLAHEKFIKYLRWKKKHPGPHRHQLSREVKEWKKYHL